MDGQYFFGQNWPNTSQFSDEYNLSLDPSQVQPTRPLEVPRSGGMTNVNNYRQTRHSLGSTATPLVHNDLLSSSWEVSAMYNRDVHEGPWDPHGAGRSTALDRTVPRHTSPYEGIFNDSGIGSASGHDKQSVVSAPTGANYVLASRRTRRPKYQRSITRAQISRGSADTLSATSELTPCVVCFHERGISRTPKNHADQK